MNEPSGSPDRSEIQGQRLKRLFDAVCELSPASQEPALVDMGAGPETVREVLELMAGVSDSTSRVTRALRPSGQLLAGSGESLRDVRLGPWRVDDLIAQGGMGRVYAAHRDDGQFEQVVAVKVIAGVADGAALAGLAQERQILAKLNHPNIARLLDGGTTPLGEPYLVMEYAPGEAIDSYCQARTPTLEARLELMLTVCEAVAFAHRQLVVHCDLKPSNILVNAEGRVVLLDFGIAGLIGSAGVLQPGGRAYTPRYASPEQMQGGAALSTATDVYSLGLVLGEVLGPDCHWELKAIVARASAADAAKRYPHVGSLAHDLRRFLARQPLEAVAWTPPYLMRKFAARHWSWLMVGAAFAASVGVLGLVLVHQRNDALASKLDALAQSKAAQAAEALAREHATVADREAQRAQREALRAQQESDRGQIQTERAQSEAARAQTSSEFLQSLFVGHGPEASSFSDGRTTVLELLDLSRRRLSGPQGAALPFMAKQDVLLTLAAGYRTHGRIVDSFDLNAQRIQLLRAHAEHPEAKPLLVSALAARARDQYIAGRLVAARADIEEAQRAFRELSLAGAVTNEVTEITVTAITNLLSASPMSWRPQEQRLLAALAQAKQLQNPSTRKRMTSHMLSWLSAFYREAGQYELAVRYGRAAVQFGELGPEVNQPTISFGVALGVLGQALTTARQPVEAEQVWRQMMAWGDQRNEQHFTEMGRAALGLVLLQRGQIGEAKEMAYRSVKRVRELYGVQSQRLPVALEMLAATQEALGAWSDAEASLRAALELRSAISPSAPWQLVGVRSLYARFMCSRGRCAEAQAMLDKARPHVATHFPPHHVDHVEFTLAQIEVWIRGDAPERAVAELLRFEQGAAAMPALVQARCLGLRAALQERQGQVDSAMETLRQAEAKYTEIFGPTSVRAIVAPAARIRLLVQQGRLREAVLLAKSIKGELESHDTDGGYKQFPWWPVVAELGQSQL